MPPRIAITLGDPRGIGPEVVGKTLADPLGKAEFVVIGPDELVAELPADERIGIGTLGTRAGRADAALAADLPLEAAGRLAAAAVLKAVELVRSGDVGAIVTGPAEKRALHAAGYAYPGHTEWLAELAGGVDVVMMLVAGTLRVALVTTHIPLAAVPSTVTIERVLKTGHITRSALECWWGIEDARLAVCALNPHGGEGGLFGAEDDEILAPAARELDAAGPIPADTVFVRALRGEFDAVLAPYHDVGMTAVKVAGFGGGVNVTLGLPFIRTAPDHGTAFDIAGRGIADAGSMREAVRLAAELATLRR
ncbi:MAG: 4-hydroxythreonine-4-phosphate dehydrogenase PdxA [Gemmatimonadota bacterium]|nr:MAG: 4-hydroxythreonine-4-phosphate dehydrogenase PdxA [Gemmatimonadota bacterium]